MSRLKIITILGTRPEIIRLSRTLIILDKFCDHKIVHTGQNYDYELNQIFFKDLGIREPDYFLNVANTDKSVTTIIGEIISSADAVFNKENPDAVLILGDTNSALSAISAKKRKIPIFHMEAGNRCFDQRVPEETNRKIVDHISDINLTYSSIAREYLLREGFPSDQIIKVGSPMKEVLCYYLPKIKEKTVLNKLQINKYSYFLVSSHREENIESEKNFEKLVYLLNQLGEVYKIPVIVSLHPRTKKKIISRSIKFNKYVKLLKPFGFFDYINLQINSKLVLSDSGTITEESSILNFPALNIRESHERPEGMEEGSVMMVGFNFERIKQGIDILSTQLRSNIRDLNEVNDYKTENVSKKVLRIIVSYTDYINRKIWKKNI
tara:strand:+ start:10269 stop:11408 length:1140 start_codon:yes stop_codon:yes gene_type:complete